MSEPIWCDVSVVLPASWGIDSSKIECIDTIADILLNGYTDCDALEGTDRVRWTLNGDGNYGLYAIEQELAWLQEHGIPYYASSDPKYEWLGEVRVFDGHNEWQRTGGPDGAVVMDYNDLKRCLDHDDPLAAVKAHFELPDINEVDISHLPASPPSEEEDE